MTYSCLMCNVDPISVMSQCRANSPDCCINFYGSPEYSMKRNRELEAERVIVKPVLADEDEITENYILVQEDGEIIPNAYRRRADDESYFNTECVALGKQNYPYMSCKGDIDIWV
jgi:formylmethanofuran dehydrogenase subunit E